MLKKTITYEDFNGETVSEEHFFHLSTAELLEMEFHQQGGMSALLEEIQNTEDRGKMIDLFKEIVSKAYGKRSPDGKKFIKTQELREEFLSSEAYSALFMDLITNENEAATFFTGMLPKDIGKNLSLPRESKPEPRVISRAEAAAMPSSELTRGLTSGTIQISKEEPKPQPRELSQAEMIEMDASELQEGLKSGRYILKSQE